MVGVDYPGEQTSTNTDGVTDHWLLVTGREYDDKTGEVRYQAMDNATAQAPTRHFTVGEDYGLTSEAPEGSCDTPLHGDGFVVRDGNLITARWPGDAERFAQELVAALG